MFKKRMEEIEEKTKELENKIEKLEFKVEYPKGRVGISWMPGTATYKYLYNGEFYNVYLPYNIIIEDICIAINGLIIYLKCPVKDGVIYLMFQKGTTETTKFEDMSAICDVNWEKL